MPGLTVGMGLGREKQLDRHMGSDAAYHHCLIFMRALIHG